MKAMKVLNALELKEFLNSIDDDELKNAVFTCRYSDDIEYGEADVAVGNSDGQAFIEIVGSSEAV